MAKAGEFDLLRPDFRSADGRSKGVVMRPDWEALRGHISRALTARWPLDGPRYSTGRYRSTMSGRSVIPAVLLT